MTEALSFRVYCSKFGAHLDNVRVTPWNDASPTIQQKAAREFRQLLSEGNLKIPEPQKLPVRRPMFEMFLMLPYPFRDTVLVASNPEYSCLYDGRISDDGQL